MAISRRILATVVIVFISFHVAWASVSESLLKVPLFEVGNLWTRSFSDVWPRMLDFFTTWPDFYSLTTYVLTVLLIFVIYHLSIFLFVPTNRVRYLGDVGYIPDGTMSLKDIANSVRKRRLVGEIPPVYPNGWFGLIEAHRLKKGASLNISVLGQNLAVFRDEEGEAHVIDAYCPHMGANMAVGGRVIGKCIECPFHGWKFRGDTGECTHIPYGEKIPSLAKVKAWPTLEINNWIYIWHHAETDEPTWLPPEIEELTRKEWTFRGRTEHYVNAHIEEIPENGADVPHLSQVHGPIMAAGIDLRFMWSKLWSFANHEWHAKWEANPEPEGHIGTMSLHHSMKIFGKRLPPIDLEVKAKQIGPGIVYLTFESIFGKGMYMQSLTPVGPMMQKMVHNVYAQRRMPTIIAKFYLYAEAIQVERDIMIWNNKKYAGKPVFVKSKEDALIAKHRRWYSQFYSENSPRLKFQKETTEW